jgi:hypothetical protein
VASPWVNTIDPWWTHAKKAVMAGDRKLTAAEIPHRVCAPFHGARLPYLKADAVDDGERTSSLS